MGALNANKRAISTEHQARLTEVVRDERLRMVVAARELENSLASAAWHRVREWKLRVYDAMSVLHKALCDTRDSADSEGSLLSEVILEAPRLEISIQKLREEYGDLERQVASLLDQIQDSSEESRKEVDDIRQRLGWLLTALKHAQAKETELLYEAFQVDIGHCD